MISTRFLPMSCTSPFTVASTITPRVAESAFSMWGSRWATAVFQQVLGEPALLLGDRWVALETLGVDDRVVEPRLRAVVEEDAVEHLAPGRWQPERDVGDAENRLALG